MGKWSACALLSIVSLVGALSACSDGAHGGVADESLGEFGYQNLNPLVTTNAGSLEGRSTLAQTLSGRLYPGVYVPGPSGQMIPNSDLVQTKVLPGEKRQVVYTISEEAVFSDSAPVTCDDYLLTFMAGQMPAMFGSHMPLFDDTSELSCVPGSKEFTLTFKEDRGARWRDLFEPGTVLPAHAIAKRVGLERDQFAEALYSEDPSRIRPIAEVWRHGFDLKSFDPELQVSFGPFQVESVGESGEVTLIRNEFYYGDRPTMSRLVVWPGNAPSQQLEEAGALQIGDLSDAHPDWFDVNEEANPLEINTDIGELTEVLTFADVGTLATPEARDAFARCVDRNAVAAESSRLSGVELPPVTVHVVPHRDPLAGRAARFVEEQARIDIDAARALAGETIRIGYGYPNSRQAAMVEQIRQSCERAGIQVIDVTEQGRTLADLGHFEVDEWGQAKVVEGSIDALLRPIDPLNEYPAAENKTEYLADLQAQEFGLWKELPDLPLAAQPRTFAVDRRVENVVAYTGLSGIGWNMDRWVFQRS